MKDQWFWWTLLLQEMAVKAAHRMALKEECLQKMNVLKNPIPVITAADLA